MKIWMNLFRKNFPDGKTNPKWPDMDGNGKDEAGNEFKIAGWVKKGKDGKKDYLSVCIQSQEKKEEQAPAADPRQAPTQRPIDDDSIPF